MRWLAAIALLLAGPASAADDFAGFMQLRASRTLLARSENVTINAGLFAPDGKPGDRVWFRGQFRRNWYDPPRQRWTTGEACPAALATLRQLHRMEMPRPVLPLPGLDDGQGEIYLDGRVYDLTVSTGIIARQAVGELHFATNVNSPLARWAEQLIADLKPCWAASLPDEPDHDAGSANSLPPPRS